MIKATITEPMKESTQKKTLPVDFITALEITLSSAKFSLVTESESSNSSLITKTKG